MSFKSLLLCAGAALSLSLTPVASAADDMSKIMIMDPYARTARPDAPTGAAFLAIMNHTGEDDRLVDVRSDIAARVQLHTHRENADGVMKMLHVEDGFAIPAGATHTLARGGDHIMFMGLKKPLEQGDMISLTLVFEKAGDVAVEIPVDLDRKPDGGAHTSGHGDHSADTEPDEGAHKDH